MWIKGVYIRKLIFVSVLIVFIAALVAEAGEPFSPKGLWVEGPTTAKIGDYWYVYFDAYKNGYYGVMKTKDFKTWEDVSEKLVYPKGMRHGSVFPVSAKILDKLPK